MARFVTDRTDNISERASADVLTFDQASALVFDSLSSESSCHIYRTTFKQWQQFAKGYNFDALDLFRDNVKSFLYSRNLSHNTRLSRKSHMLKLLLVVSNRDSRFAQHYVQLREYKIQHTARDNPPQRKPSVLSSQERRRLRSVWKDDVTHKGIRNCAVVCLLLYTGIHTNELTALRWEDFDWDAQTLSVDRGNDGQRYSVPILDDSPNTTSALRKLKCAQKSALLCGDAPYKRIFPALSTGRNACFLPGKDVHTSAQTIRNIIAQTSRIAGLGNLTPRDLRHTSLKMFAKAVDFNASVQSLTDG